MAIAFAIGSSTVPRTIYAQDSLRIYETGYTLEKNYPIFSIPLYERVLASSADTKLKKVAATRLYYIYKKFRKYPEILSLYSRYGNLAGLGKEHGQTIQEIIRHYRISGAQFYKVYPIIQNPHPETTSELLEILMEESSRPLLEFVYFFMMSKGQYEELRTLLYYLPESIAPPILRMGLLVKMQEPDTIDVMNQYLEREGLTKSNQADAFYLAGIFHRSQRDLEPSLEALKMSQELANPDRAKREIAKTWVSFGRVPEACKLGPFPNRDFPETDLILHLICKNEKPIKELQQALSILADREDHADFYRSSVRWLWGK